ncbi:MAG: Adenylate cyclase [Myxococcaceae bacterium]|nr:Adenylate cyclase [Myxococcaceae bacterium]
MSDAARGTHGRLSMLPERLPTRLLYVEDDDDLRDMIADTLVDAGFVVTAVASAEAALESLRGGGFDILVTDYHLTGETGVWLLESATAAGLLANTAAIMLTSVRRPPGAEGYTVLRKPVDIGTLLDAISAAVGQSLPPAVEGPAAARAPELELVLYVTSSSQESLRAIRNLDRALKPYHRGRYSLAVVDVSQGGDDAWYQALEDDRVIVTPTLVKKGPGPKTWIVGTLSPIDAVAQLLISALGEAGAASGSRRRE